VRSTAAALCSH